MKTIIIIMQSGKVKEALIYPLKRYKSIEMHYTKDNNLQFRKFLTDFFEHRGLVETWQIVDECQMYI